MSTDRELINRLLTIAGMIMEDASSTMIIADDGTSASVRIAGLGDTARSLQAIARAADLVCRHPDMRE